MINTLVFDFGRVISAPKSPSLFQGYEKILGLKPDSINGIMFNSLAWQKALTGSLTEREYWYAIGSDLGLFTQEAIDTFRHQYRADETINTGILELLDKVYGRYKLALLSNWPAGLKQWLNDWRISHFFNVIFCSGDEGLAKPDPAVYRITLERIGSRPEEAVFIDDALENVEASRAVGMQGILFTTVPELRKELAAIEIL